MRSPATRFVAEFIVLSNFSIAGKSRSAKKKKKGQFRNTRRRASFK